MSKNTLSKITGHCLITGASHGIGKAIAYEWASKGVSIVAVAIDGDALNDLKEDIESKYEVSCVILTKDLLSPDTPNEIFNWCEENQVKIQVLVNNVGLGSAGSFEDTTLEFDVCLVKLNIFPMIQLTKLFLPTLKMFEKSYILNMSSLGSYRPIPYKALYTASKAFIYSFSKAISSELKEDNVQVSVSCPAGVYTNADVVDRIKASGKIAKWTSLYVDIVASYIVNGMLKGKSLIIPGRGAKVLMVLMRLMPESLNRWMVGRNMKRNQRA
jgi:short-subunit dehydrogenase